MAIIYNYFKCESDDREKHLGFTSWDNFFTRLFNPGIRPVQDPEDPIQSPMHVNLLHLDHCS